MPRTTPATLALLLLGFWLAACVKVDHYPHEPTFRMGKIKLGSEKLAPYSHGGVFFRPYHEPNRIRFRGYAAQPTTARINRLVLSGAAGCAEPSHTSTEVKTLAVKDPHEDQKGIFESDKAIVLILDGWGVDDLGRKCTGLVVEVEVEVEGAQPPTAQLRYEMDQAWAWRMY